MRYKLILYGAKPDCPELGTVESDDFQQVQDAQANLQDKLADFIVAHNIETIQFAFSYVHPSDWKEGEWMGIPQGFGHHMIEYAFKKHKDRIQRNYITNKERKDPA